jgi:formylglycine-generating enzyme required for sulfatase activity
VPTPSSRNDSSTSGGNGADRSSRPLGADRDARHLAEELGITGRPGTSQAEASREDGPLSASTRDGGHLRLDKCGALEGQPKLKPVRAYARPGGAGDFHPGSRQSADVVAPRTAKGPRPRKAVLPPKIGSLRPPEHAPPERGPSPVAAPHVPRAEAPPASEPEDVLVPAATFLYGEEREARELPAFRIDRRPVTHGEYEDFVRATGHRKPVYWPGGQMPEDLRDHPVVGIDYYDALAFARWRGKDLPFEDEWERAARGVDGRAYPWGNDPDVQAANTARSGIKMTVPVGFYAQNVSPEGVVDLVGNAWEFTHSPAPGGGVVVRGGSWYDFALYAKK